MASERNDPIRAEYFTALDWAEKANDWIFNLAALASLATLLVDKTASPIIYELVQSSFILLVIAGWGSGILVRVYLWPRAQSRRFKDFVSHAFGIRLANSQTQGYYNSTATGDERIGAQVMENAFHSKETAGKMVVKERTKVAVFVLLLTLALLYRRTDLGFIAVIAQAIFSEQMLSKWIRMEWLRSKFETIFEELFRLFTCKPEPQAFRAAVFELTVEYETAKANAAITLSDKIFQRRNPEVSAEWEKIRQIHNL